MATVKQYVLISIPHRRVARQFVTKNIYLGIIAARKKLVRRRKGYGVRFASNKVLLLTDHKKLVGTRLYGPVAKELEHEKITKLFVLARKLC
jgi:large subunit ribosomal protein L14